MSCRVCNKCSKNDSRIIALVGNPNVGKSVIFNLLSGVYAEVSNYPGTTVDTPIAVTAFGKLIDTPGIYEIAKNNDEEIITQNIILKATFILNIVSAINLERDLFLTMQLIERGYSLIIALNQYDDATSRGININTAIIEKELGVRVIPTIATQNKGVDQIKYHLLSNCEFPTPQLPPYLKEFINENNINTTDTNYFINEIETKPLFKESLNHKRINFINNVINNSLSTEPQKQNISEVIGNMLLNPIIGSLFALFVLFALYQVIGVLVAGELVNYLVNDLILKYYSPFIEHLTKSLIHNTTITEILVGKFGIFTMTVEYLLGVLLPLFLSFSIFMSILEDSGYLPRFAALTDRFLNKIGLNGRAIIPIILGFGCVTMATITTRILGSNREKIIANTILGLIIPCSAQIGIIIALLAVIGGIKAWIIYLLSISTVLIITGSLLNKLLPGESSSLFIDLPPMRIPIVKNILKKTFSKTKHFLLEATPLFFLGALIVSILYVFGILDIIQKLLAPIIVNLLNLPPQTAAIFILGLIRRDLAAAGLANIAGFNTNHILLSPAQIIVSLVVITLFVPCIASVVVMLKERGWKETGLIWVSSIVIAFIFGAILSFIINTTHII